MIFRAIAPLEDVGWILGDETGDPNAKGKIEKRYDNDTCHYQCLAFGGRGGEGAVLSRGLVTAFKAYLMTIEAPRPRGSEEGNGVRPITWMAAISPFQPCSSTV